MIGVLYCAVEELNGHPPFNSNNALQLIVKLGESGGHDDDGVVDVNDLQTNLQHFERSLYRRYGLVSVVSAQFAQNFSGIEFKYELGLPLLPLNPPLEYDLYVF